MVTDHRATVITCLTNHERVAWYKELMETSTNQESLLILNAISSIHTCGEVNRANRSKSLAISTRRQTKKETSRRSTESSKYSTESERKTLPTSSLFWGQGIGFWYSFGAGTRQSVLIAAGRQCRSNLSLAPSNGASWLPFRYPYKRSTPSYSSDIPYPNPPLPFPAVSLIRSPRSSHPTARSGSIACSRARRSHSSCFFPALALTTPLFLALSWGVKECLLVDEIRLALGFWTRIIRWCGEVMRAFVARRGRKNARSPNSKFGGIVCSL